MRILSRRSAVVPGSLIALLSFVFQACFQDDKVAGPETPASRPGSTASAWELHPALPGGEIREGHLDGVPITYQVVEGKSIWEGDIVLTEEQLSRQPAAKASSAGKSRLDSRWTHNIVPYVIAPDLPNPARVIDAMTHWQAKTNLRFVPRTNEGNLVTFASGNGCLSYLGMIGGNQTITLEDGCSTGSTIHAIGHAVGFHHEHRRATRDSNIVVNFDNIEAGMEHNFRTYVQQHWDGFDNFEFDFSSIMLYDSYAFSKNGLPTMTRRDGSTFTSQGNVLSEGDLALAAVMYPKVWQKRGRPGNTKARDIGVSFNGDAFAIGSDIIPGTNGGYGIYRWDGSSWTTFPGSGIAIDVDPSGNPWVLDAEGYPCQYDGAAWVKHTAGGGGNIDIGVGGGGVVYVVNKDGYSRWDGHSWNSFPGGGIAVDVDPSGNPWIINAGGYPLQYQNGDLVLLYVSGRKARDISITADGSVYIVSSEPAWGSFQIMKWTGNGWTDVIGAARRIAGGSADNPWAADVGGEIWQR